MAAQLLPSDNSGSNWLDSVLKLTGGAVDAYAKLNESKVNSLETKASIPSNTLPAAQPAAGGFVVDQKTMLIAGGVLAAVVAVPLIVRAVRG